MGNTRELYARDAHTTPGRSRAWARARRVLWCTRFHADYTRTHCTYNSIHSVMFRSCVQHVKHNRALKYTRTHTHTTQIAHAHSTRTHTIIWPHDYYDIIMLHDGSVLHIHYTRARDFHTSGGGARGLCCFVSEAGYSLSLCRTRTVYAYMIACNVCVSNWLQQAL